MGSGDDARAPVERELTLRAGRGSAPLRGRAIRERIVALIPQLDALSQQVADTDTERTVLEHTQGQLAAVRSLD